MDLVTACAAKKRTQPSMKHVKGKWDSTVHTCKRSRDECLPSPAVQHIRPIFHLWWCGLTFSTRYNLKHQALGHSFIHGWFLGFHPLDGKFRSRTYMQFYVWVAGMFIPSWIIKISIFRSDKSFSGCRYTLSTSFIFSLNILKCSEVEKYKSHMLLTFV